MEEQNGRPGSRAGLPLKVMVPLVILALGIAALVLIVKTRPVAVEEPRTERAPLVRVAVARPAPMVMRVKAHGTVVPRREGDLVSQVAGLVTWVSPVLASGGFFEEGEPLLRIERDDYEVALESARAAVARAESEFDRATKELARQKRLADRSVASEALFDDAKNAERVARAVLREARAMVRRAERDLERTELRAPYQGRVRTADVDVGEFVARGGSVGRIYAVDYAEVRLPLPDAELRYLDLPMLFQSSGAGAGDVGDAPESAGGARAAPGLPSEGPEVVLRARFAGERHSWRGRIVRTEGEIDPTSRMVHVVVRVADPYGLRAQASPAKGPPLAVGLFVEAEIEGRRIDEAVALPRAAMHGETSVLVVDAESRLHERPVEVARLEGDRVVVAAGLRSGDRVIVSPLREVMDGMTVRVADAEMRREAGGPPGALGGAS